MIGAALLLLAGALMLLGAGFAIGMLVAPRLTAWLTRDEDDRDDD